MKWIHCVYAGGIWFIWCKLWWVKIVHGRPFHHFLSTENIRNHLRRHHLSFKFNQIGVWPYCSDGLYGDILVINALPQIRLKAIVWNIRYKAFRFTCVLSVSCACFEYDTFHSLQDDLKCKSQHSHMYVRWPRLTHRQNAHWWTRAHGSMRKEHIKEMSHTHTHYANIHTIAYTTFELILLSGTQNQTKIYTYYILWICLIQSNFGLFPWSHLRGCWKLVRWNVWCNSAIKHHDHFI